MARTCSICVHPERAAIEKQIVNQVGYRTVADRYGVSKTALLRHKDRHLPAQLVAAQAADDLAAAIDVQAELSRCLERVNLLFDAADRWLRDPDDASRYTLEPRSEEVRVVYKQRTADGDQRRTAPLSVLLAQLEAGGMRPESWEAKTADPRDVLLKAAARLQGHLELLAKLVGELDERPTIAVFLASPEWVRVQATLLDALWPYPEARVAAADALMRLEAGDAPR